MPRACFDILGLAGVRRGGVGSLHETADGAIAQAQALPPPRHRPRGAPGGDWHGVCCDVRDGEGRIIDRGELTDGGRRRRG